MTLVNAESPSRNKALADQCGRVLKKEFERLVGGTVQVIPQKDVGDQYLMTVGGTEDITDQLLILGHYDTVWEKGDLSLRREGNVLYGPGVFDMKGGLTVVLWALHALKTQSILPKKRIVFLVTSDEEIGSEASKTLIEQEAMKSSLVIVPESSLSPHAGIKTARKGVGIYQIKVTGIPAHAGVDPWGGASAIEELLVQLQEIKKLENRELGLSVNFGLIQGGSRTNVIAKDAEASIDVRFIKSEHALKVDEAIRKRTSFIKGTSIEVTGGINRFPLERTEKVEGLFKDLQMIARSHGYELEEGLSGGGSDGNLAAALGIPVIDGLGPQGDGAHSLNEHLILSNLPYRAALIAEFIKKHSC